MTVTGSLNQLKNGKIQHRLNNEQLRPKNDEQQKINTQSEEYQPTNHFETCYNLITIIVISQIVKYKIDVVIDVYRRVAAVEAGAEESPVRRK